MKSIWVLVTIFFVFSSFVASASSEDDKKSGDGLPGRRVGGGTRTRNTELVE